jgi:glycosyltransferase involved in cell wall biosynthesis
MPPVTAPTVSVVMPTHDDAPFLREAVASILGQTLADLELIVVDDASRDETPRILAACRDPRVSVITNPANTGVARARNDGMARARGRFIAVMDSDDVSAPRRLEAQVGFLAAHPEIGLVGSGIFDNIDRDGTVLFTTLLPETDEEISRTLPRRWCFVHTSILFRRELLEAAGGYRSQFPVAEDHDFLLRILEHTRAWNLRENLVSYRINPRSLTVAKRELLPRYESLALELAAARRAGRPEELEARVAAAAPLPARPRFFPGLSDSWYVSARYYGFGTRQLFIAERVMARRCFTRSLRNNPLYLKAWAGLILSLLPAAATAPFRRFFGDTARYYEELARDGSRGRP